MNAPNTPARGVRADAAAVRAALARKATKEAADAAELADKIEEDYQFAFVKRVLLAHLSVAPVTCGAAPERQSDPRAADLATWLIDLWHRCLPQIAAAYGTGRSAFAVEWAYDPKTNLHRPKLHAIPFGESAPKWNPETGEFEGIAVGKDLVLPPGRCWHCPTDADALHPHGRSRYLGAARKEWERRGSLFELWEEHVEHFALRGGVAYGPGVGVGPDGEEIDLAANMQQAHAMRRPGSLLYVEGERDGNGRFPQEFVEPPTLDPPAPLDAALGESDIRVLRSQGLSELSVQQTGDLGSYALAVVHRLVTVSVVYELAGQWGGGFGRYVCEPAAKHNFGDAKAVLFDTPRLTELPDSTVGELAKAVLAQPTLSPVAAAVDLRRLLESGGVPVGDDFEDRLSEAVAAQTRLTLGGRSTEGAGPSAAAMADDDPGDFAPPPGLPHPDEFADVVEAELADLYGRAAALYTRHGWPTPEVRKLIEQAERLAADAAEAADLLGRAAVAVPPETLSGFPYRLPSEVSMADDGPVSRWAWVARVRAWLGDRGLPFGATRPDPEAAAKSSAAGVLASLRESAASALSSAGDATERLRDAMRGPIADARQRLRDGTRRAYLAGRDATLTVPRVAALYPYDEFRTQHDSRVRREHRPLDGLIVKRGTPEHATALRALADHNCRCEVKTVRASAATGRNVVGENAALPSEIANAYG
ncbi:hypothetical protein [Alienimonas sp. DA493]|uniref:hypothetical protein n=1 Tax=Alienimonas sp. DA493 TaxID=3373605 RepID=UPI0037544048